MKKNFMISILCLTIIILITTNLQNKNTDEKYFKAIKNKSYKEESMNSKSELIFKKGMKGPEALFTGNTWVNMLVTDTDNTYNTQVYDVVFEAGARTKWHSHPGGQLLFGTSGKGFYQEKGKEARILKKGDVVEIAPNIVHWHGASANTDFVHLGISSKTQEGPAEWLGEVTDKQYYEAIKNK